MWKDPSSDIVWVEGATHNIEGTTYILVTHASTNLLDRIIRISIYKTSYYHLVSTTNY